jgi:hypothetical protein
LPASVKEQTDRSLSDTATEFLSRHATASIGCLLVGSAVSALVASRTRPLWFDELGTYTVAGQPTLAKMFAAAPPDGQPPLYYLFAHGSMALFGRNAFALRLPALIAFLVTLYCLYLFVRRRTEPLYGLLAAMTLGASRAAWYAAEARPYTVLIAGTVLALVFWQSATMRTDANPLSPLKGRIPALAGLSLAVAIAIMAHAYGVIYVGLPLLIGESMRLIQRRRPDLPIVAAVLMGLSALVVTVPMIYRSHAALFGQLDARTLPYSTPTIPRLIVDTASIANSSPLMMLLLLMLLSRRRVASGQDAPSPVPHGGFPRHETVVAITLTTLVLVSWTISATVTHYYFWRYGGMGSLLGVAILTVWLVYSLPFRRTLALSLLAVFSLYLFIPLWSAFFRPPVAFGRSKLIAQGDPKLKVVVASPFDLLAIYYYADPALRQRLHYIANRPLSEKLHDPVAEITISGFAARHALPMSLDELQPFLDHNSRFLVIAGGGERAAWLPAELRRRGYQLSFVAARTYGNPEMTHFDPSTLFLVTAPASAQTLPQPGSTSVPFQTMK